MVGLDPSLTGFGMVIYNFFTGEHAAFLLKTKPEPSTRRLLRIQDWVASQLRSAGPERIAQVCIEDYAREVKNGREESGALRHASLLGLYDVFGDEPLAYPGIVAISTLKKFVTGKGTGKKELILLHVYKKWGVEFSDNNLADAYGLARIAGALVSGREPEHKYERESLAAVGRTTWEPPQQKPR